MNQKLKTIGLLIAPSLGSTIGVLGAVLVVFAGTFVKYGRVGFYDLLLGSESSPDLINKTHDIISEFYQLVFGNSTLNKILFFGFWMMIGLIVYFFIMSTSHTIGEADEAVHELSYVHVKRQQFIHSLVIKLAIKTAVVIGAIVYSIVFVKLFFPFALASIMIATGSITEITGIKYGLIGILGLCISLHVYVVLARLFLQRLRIFNT